MRIFPAFIVAIAFLAAAPFSMGQTFRTLFDFPHLSGDPSENIIAGSDGNFYGCVGGGTANGEGLIVRISPEGNVTPLHIFRSYQKQGSDPVGALVEIGDGVFYGVTTEGGNHGYGTIFKITRAGELTTLHHFNSLNGANPRSGLTLGNDGNLYGVTPLGGAVNKGCIYRVTPAGAVTVVYSIPEGAVGHPYARLAKGNDGALYGALVDGQVLFKVTTSGVFTSLHVLGPTEGATILSAMVRGPDGNLYGTASAGATNNSGTVFRMTPTGAFTVLFRFTSANGVTPNSVVFGPDGNLYGTTRTGGANQYGTLFRLSTTGTFTRLRSFSSTEGERPTSGLAVKDGVLYGAVGQASGVFFSLTTAGVFTPIARFDDKNLGSDPRSRLIQASDGNFYGTAYTGGGVVYRVTPQGEVKVLHSFARADGISPVGSLIEASDGNFYGVTSSQGPNGRGTIYRLTRSGEYTILHSFTVSGSVLAAGGLVEGDDGNFYGLLSQNGDTNSGSIYRLTPAGAFSIIHNFNNTLHGGFPGGALVKGADGSLYGTTHSGGGGDGMGTVFRVSPTGVYSVIARIPYLAYRIQDGLIFGPDGHLYGIALYNGGSDSGALIRCTLDGTYSVVTNFGGAKGSTPMAGPVMGPDGNFYGTTSRSVAGGPGSVYKVTPSGTVTTLKNFTGIDGDTPLGGVTVGLDGDLYGTTSTGGRGGGGTVFSLDIFPTISGMEASEITPRSAKLRAIVDPNSGVTAVDFRMANAVLTTASIPAGNGGREIAHVATGLLPHTKYSFQVEARNGIAGPVRSEVLEFETANTAPQAEPRLWHAKLDASGNAMLDVSAQLSDADGDQLSITAHTQGVYGDVTLDGTTFTYRVRSNAVGFTGNDSFTYTVSDGFGGTATGTVTLVNAAPTARNQALHSPAGNSFTIDVNPLLNDSDSDQLRIARVTQGSHGSVSFEGNQITYSVTGSGYQGNDSFTFTVEDGAGGVATGTITLTNVAPTASTHSIHPAFGPGGETLISLTSISSDDDGDELTLTTVEQGTNGHVSIVEGGIRYVARLDFTGNDSFAFTVTDGRGARASGSITFTNRAPVAQSDVFTIGPGTATLNVLSADTDPDGDSIAVLSVGTAPLGRVSTDGVRVVYNPGVAFEGVDSFSYTITDHRGATSSAQVSIRANYPVQRELATNVTEVPGVEKGRWREVGFPSIISGGDRAGWLATVRKGNRSFRGIFEGPLGSPSLLLQTGDKVPNLEGDRIPKFSFKHFQQPVFTDDGYAFIGRAGRAETSRDDRTGVWVNAGGLLRAVALQDSLAPGTLGSRFARFSSLVMPGPSTAFFTARLKNKRVGERGLWVWNEERGVDQVLQVGEIVNLGSGTRRVRSFEVLSPTVGSGGHGRYDSSTMALDAVIKYSDKEMSLVTIGSDGIISAIRTTGEADEQGRIALKFGIPSSPGNGRLPAALVTFRETAPKSASFETVFDFETNLTVARESQEVPGRAGARFKTFKDPVAGYGMGNTPVIAFSAVLAGEKPGRNSGVWSNAGGQLQAVALEGDDAPGTPGAKFASFESLSIVEGRGPIFTAELKPRAGVVGRRTDRGCWAVASDGSLQLLIREGQSIKGRTIRKFNILDTVHGSEAQRRAWTTNDPTPTVIYRAYFEDGSQGILAVSIP